MNRFFVSGVFVMLVVTIILGQFTISDLKQENLLLKDQLSTSSNAEK